MIASAMVAIEKKMPRIRRVSRPTAKAEQHADDRGGCDLHHERRAGRLEQGDRRVDADAEEGVGAEIDVAGIAAEDAPGDRERDELQDHVAGKERIFVADDLRHRQDGDEEDGHAGPERDAVATLRHRPSRPCGRTASTPSSIANEIAGAQEAPNMVSTMDFGDAEDDGGNQRAAHAAEPGHDHDAECPPDIGAVERRLDGRHDDQQRTGDPEHGGGDAEGKLLDADRVGAHQPQRLLVLRDRADRAAHEGFRQIHREQHRQRQRDRERDQLPDRYPQSRRTARTCRYRSP